MLKKGQIEFGDIVWTQFDPSIGHEFQDKRPAVVIQTNKQISRSNLVTVIPLTGNLTNKVDDDIIIHADNENNLKSNSLIKVYNIASCDYSRFCGVIGHAGNNIMHEIRLYLKKHFGI
ncbi:type II toxin-antitoxin system PemK/MazF family toxin [Candidatus Falkowbacteria bacterium]|jgi:mRNA-degrading endonuclease toxin of MazEF toxin-antitoxin module|nr:type II toxin-antitoxin system PemK/MazF family toxin [Candidatus Falkowbacteria bacterium]MBT6573842.1 type II toxin-antitoxin system PemK/MazF family toxin [Candidatus Falkowbacteria bacterium]MBT7501236.1 type II toxin-antitoxin system PemK/MazF family toxin [Candidatus Falkowbacteria bacterium]